jgi:hypothetical protein
MKKLLLVAVILGAVAFAWQKTRQSQSVSSPEPSVSLGGATCADRAREASEQFGDGIGQFVNPPVDPAAWDIFRGTVETKIGAAEAECSCVSEACRKGREALTRMRGVLRDLQASAQSGTPFATNLASEQEAIDAAIEEAARLAQ